MNQSILLNNLEGLQFMKYWLLHEKARHMKDIMAINKDLAKLEDIEMPDGMEYVLFVDIQR